MNNIERRDRQILYISDDAVFEEQKKCRAILQKLNFMDRADFAGISTVVKELFGTSDGAFVNPPFFCDYGSHIHVGKNFFANYNCTIIDVAPVVIGDNCQMAPNVAIYTAGHPVHPATRNTAYEYGIGVTINPCKVIRKITEADRETWFHNVPVDQEALKHMRQIWADSSDPIRYPAALEE